MAYLQAGIPGPGPIWTSLGEIGALLVTFVRNIRDSVTFTRFWTTFWLPRPDSRLPAGLPGPRFLLNSVRK